MPTLTQAYQGTHIYIHTHTHTHIIILKYLELNCPLLKPEISYCVYVCGYRSCCKCFRDEFFFQFLFPNYRRCIFNPHMFLWMYGSIINTHTHICFGEVWSYMNRKLWFKNPSLVFLIVLHKIYLKNRRFKIWWNEKKILFKILQKKKLKSS